MKVMCSAKMMLESIELLIGNIPVSTLALFVETFFKPAYIKIKPRIVTTILK